MLVMRCGSGLRGPRGRRKQNPQGCLRRKQAWHQLVQEPPASQPLLTGTAWPLKTVSSSANLLPPGAHLGVHPPLVSKRTREAGSLCSNGMWRRLCGTEPHPHARGVTPHTDEACRDLTSRLQGLVSGFHSLPHAWKPTGGTFSTSRPQE